MSTVLTAPAPRHGAIKALRSRSPGRRRVPTPRPATVADDLREAARLIEVHGWAQGAMRHEDGGLCALAALALVAGVLHELVHVGYPVTLAAWTPRMYRYHEMVSTLSCYLVRHHLEPTGIVPAWNDTTEGLTADGVCRTLRVCAAEYEEMVA